MTLAHASSRVRVFLADDHPVVLSGIKALVMADAEIELVGEATDGPTALKRAIEQRPDVAVLDLSMPGLTGIEITRKLLPACPRCRILVLTVHEDLAYVRKLLKLGVSGYLLKRSAAEKLREGIHAVAAGEIYLDPALAEHADATPYDETKDSKPDAPACELSGREIEVVRLTAMGHSNKMIAAKLQIGVRSVETYKARAMEKLGFRSRVALVRFAAGEGWLGTDGVHE